MGVETESPYRVARRAFIAACEAAHVDSIARLHPSRDKDGKPLFMDSAALGPRLASHALLVTAADAAGSAIMVDLLKDPLPLPKDMRLILVHALDPAAFAGVSGDPQWPVKMLAAVATEDLSRVGKLDILPLHGSDADPLRALSEALPRAIATCHGPPPETADEARAVIASIFAG